MTGIQLINWIIENKAEDMYVAVQFRDGGGSYQGGELVDTDSGHGTPCLAHIRCDSAGMADITYGGLTPNAIIL